jgi:hypothetical protein
VDGGRCSRWRCSRDPSLPRARVHGVRHDARRRTPGRAHAPAAVVGRSAAWALHPGSRNRESVLGQVGAVWARVRSFPA